MQEASQGDSLRAGRRDAYDLDDRIILQEPRQGVGNDAVIIDNTAASGYMGTNPDKLKVAGDKFTSEGLGIVVRKDASDLQSAFNAALKELKENGTLENLYQKWFVEWKPS